jgi:hypothetical protein
MAGVALCFTACTDLSEDVYNKIPADSFGKTPEQASAMVNSAYTTLRGDAYDDQRGYAAGEYIYYMGALSSDEAILPACNEGRDWLDGFRYMELLFHDFKSNSEATTGAWRYAYKNIANINNIITNTVEPLSVDSVSKRAMLAELRALRAYHYFRLLDWFGNVPLMKSFSDTTALTNENMRPTVFEFTRQELEESVPYLPETGYGRMIKNAGLCLLSRLYLNAYVFKYPDYQDRISYYNSDPDGYYARVVEVCNMANGVLEADYFTNFLEKNEVSNENLFTVVYDKEMDGSEAYGNWHVSHTTHEQMKWMVSPTGKGAFGTGTIRVKPGVYGTFEAGDARRNAIAAGECYYMNDPSKGVITFELNERGRVDKNAKLIFTEDVSDIIDVYQREGYRLKKYQLVDNMEWCSNHDLVLMRYAEILLNRAEALVRLGRPQEAAADLTAIRTRANLTGASQTGSITMESVELERRHEFFFEDMRRTDMIRYGTFSSLSWLKPQWAMQVTERQPRIGDKNTNLYPVPDLEMKKNPLLKQNPGYN